MFGVKWKISINKNSFLNLKKLLKRGGKCFLFSKNKNQFLLFLCVLLFIFFFFFFVPLLPSQFVAIIVTQLTPPLPREIIQSSGGPCHLSTIPLKDSYLFKIAKSVISFCFKKISNLAILNRWEFLTEMVDHVTYPL